MDPSSAALALAFGWSVLAGALMASGAGGGGVLAGIGHLSILGINDPNQVKVLNQILEFSSRIVSVPLYVRQRRVVASLALCYGIGAPLGAVIGAWFSKRYLGEPATYRLAFGVLVTLVAARTLYEAWATRAARPRTDEAPRTVRFGWDAATVRYGTETFEFRPLMAAAGGFVIGCVGSALGVGGGFLATPFMASVLAFPMMLVAGTSVVALMLPLAVSVATYLLLEVRVDWTLVAIEVPGVWIGSFLAPLLVGRLDERRLKAFVGSVLFLLGVYYLGSG